MRRRSLASLRNEFPRYPHWDELEGFIAGVSQELEPLAITLFGSLVKGDFTQHSDIDVLVVLPQEVPWVEVYRFSQGIVQPLVKTERELLEQIRQCNTFLIEVVKEGLVLYGDEEFLDRLEGALRETEQKFSLKRIPGGWRFSPKPRL